MLIMIRSKRIKANNLLVVIPPYDGIFYKSPPQTKIVIIARP